MEKKIKSVVEVLNALEKGNATVDITDMQPKNSVFSGDYGKAVAIGVEFNETRYNISLSVHIPGVLHVKKDGLPESIETCAFRRVAIVTDGVLVRKSLDVVGWLHPENVLDVLPSIESHVVFEGMDILPELAITSEQDYFRSWHGYQVLKGDKKVLEYLYAPYLKKNILAEKYGEENAEYLRSLGLTDSGWSPSSPYVADRTPHPEVVTKIKGLDVPSMNALMQKIASGKPMNAGETLLYTSYSSMSDFVNGIDESSRKEILEKHLASVRDMLRAASASLAMYRDGKMFGTLEPGATMTMPVEVGGVEMACSMARKN